MATTQDFTQPLVRIGTKPDNFDFSPLKQNRIVFLYRNGTGEREDQIRHFACTQNQALGVSANVWLNVNTSFHETLARFSNNQFIAAAVEQQNNLRRMREAAIFDTLPIERVRLSCDEHLAILDAVEVNNLQWAEALMREHLKKAAGK